MHLLALIASALLMSLADQVRGVETFVGQYGETIEVPCNKGNTKPEDLLMKKWKYSKSDGSTGDLVKSTGKNVTLSPDAEYTGRIGVTEDFGLRIARAKLSDQKVFTCMVAVSTDILEYPVQVTILKAPSQPTITNKALNLQIGKLQPLGDCATKDANPAANVTWFKNGVPLASDGKVVKVTVDVLKDKDTGLASTSSKLEYAAVKGDLSAKFTCEVQHKALATNLASLAETFVINYPTEKVSLEIVSKSPIREGDNVTLKCKADGNPPPSSYSFYIKEKTVKVENSDNYTLAGITRADTGEYKCSLVDDDTLTDSKSIRVMYLDVSLVTPGKIVKQVGENFEAELRVNTSGDPQVSWFKNNVKLNAPPKFDKLKYTDSGRYESVISMAGMVKKVSFELNVQGAPVISKLTKQRSEDGNFKVLTCEAWGSPKPTVSWSVNGTNATESTYADGKSVHKIKIIPTVNLTVTCTVSNDLGKVLKSIDVSTLFDEVTVDKREQAEEATDQTKVVVGVVLGLLLAALVSGLAYWIYVKRTRQGTWKTGEKEDGTTEESKKLEENQSQKTEA